MSKRKPRERIPVNAAQTPLSVNPFAALDLQALDCKEMPAEERPTHSVAKKPSRFERARLFLRRETAHRGGKAVIVVTAFPSTVSDKEISVLARELRIACGAGGTVRGREIEIQGDAASRIRVLLNAKGFQVGGEK